MKRFFLPTIMFLFVIPAFAQNDEREKLKEEIRKEIEGERKREQLEKEIREEILIEEASKNLKAEWDDVRWGKENRIQSKVHVKDVVNLEGMSVSEIRELIKRWYLETFVDKRLTGRSTYNASNGKTVWSLENETPFVVETENRVFTRFVKCQKCIMSWGTSKEDGLFKMNIEMRQGRVLLVISDYYSESEDTYLSNFLIKRKKLVTDKRVDFLVEHYKSVTQSLLDYRATYDPSKPLRKVDDW